MATSHLSTVLSAIVSLDDGELDKVKQKIVALRSVSGLPKEKLEVVASDFLLDAIHQELRRLGLMRANSRIPANRIPENYKTESVEIRKFLLEAAGAASAAEIAALGQVAIRALGAYLQNRAVPLGPNTFLNNIAKVPTAIEASFPGYLGAGLLGYCWRKRKGGG